MVLVQLKGVHTVKAKLASGKRAEYHYAWKGGPRLTGAPGSPEFVAAYQSAHAARRLPSKATLHGLLTRYKMAPEYLKLSEHSKRAYKRYLDLIQAEFGDMPTDALRDRGVRADFVTWRNTMQDRPRTADYAMSVLKSVLGWAVEAGELDFNPAAEVKKLHRVNRSDSVWTADHLSAFKRHASAELAQAVELAMYTGLRQSDLIRLTWSAYDGESFAWLTAKRSKDVLIPATAECRALMGRIKKLSPVILTSHKLKRPWTADGLRASFSQACKEAGVKRTFHDLRRTAATNLLMAGVEKAHVAMIMGWEEDAVEALKRKYVSRSAVMKAALAKMEPGR